MAQGIHDPSVLSKALDSEQVFQFDSRFRKVSYPSGEYKGNWIFYEPEAGRRWPSLAIWFDVSDQPPYAVRLKLYCDESSPGCAALRNSLVYYPAPKPVVESAGQVLDEWRIIVLHEACQRAPAELTPPYHPAEELRRRIGGQVELGMLYDSCGAVREASVLNGSGNANLDRKAVKRAETWVLPVPQATKVGGKAKISIMFAPIADGSDIPREAPRAILGALELEATGDDLAPSVPIAH
jgi:TonB family protein